MNSGLLALIGLGFVLGARHAVDWDHMAAIGDFLGAEEGKKQGFALSVSYILGHETVNLALGILAIFLGRSLPDWVDGIMERLVGATLLILGLWLFIIILQNKNNPVLVSRWKLLYLGIRRLSRLASEKLGGKTHSHTHQVDGDIGLKGAFLIGVMHGIGAETASQMLLFIAAAGAGTLVLGLSAVFAFIAGLFTAQLLMVLLLMAGYRRFARSKKFYNGIALATSVYSLALGSLYLLGRGKVLPSITAFFGS